MGWLMNDALIDYLIQRISNGDRNALGELYNITSNDFTVMPSLLYATDLQLQILCTMYTYRFTIVQNHTGFKARQWHGYYE